MLKRILLLAPIVYIPNSLRFSPDMGVPGLNIANLLFIVLLVALAFYKDPTRQPRRSTLTLPILAFYLALIVAFFIALSTMPLDATLDFMYLKDAIFYPLFYFIYRKIPLDDRDRRLLVLVILLVAVVAALQAIRQGIDYGLAHFSDFNRAAGPFGDDWRSSNRAGPFYAMFVPLFVAAALFYKDRKIVRLMALGACLMLGAAIMFTYSRQSYGIALAMTALLLLRKNIVFAAIIAIVMVGSIDYLPNSVTQRVERTEQRNSLGEEVLDDSTESRFIIWSGAIAMWEEHPLGVGLNRFKEYIGGYQQYNAKDAHNFYVLTLGECGPLGVIALLWLIWRLFKLSLRFGRAAKNGPEDLRALSIGFGPMVIAMALGNVYGSRFLDGAIMVNLWILAALVESFTENLEAKREPVKNVAPVNLPSIAARFPLAARALPGAYRAIPRDPRA